MEQTFLMIKPDGVERGLVGEIISRLENKGMTLRALKMLTPTRDMAENHYAVHRDKPFFDGVVLFITSGNVVAMIWEGPSAVAICRKLIGATKPEDSTPGTIRGDYANTTEKNLIHGSDSVDNAATEIAIWF